MHENNLHCETCKQLLPALPSQPYRDFYRRPSNLHLLAPAWQPQLWIKKIYKIIKKIGSWIISDLISTMLNK